MRVALDTSILAYAEGIDDEARRVAAISLMERIPQLTAFLPTQVLGELFRVLMRKGRYTAQRAQETVLGWTQAFSLIDTSQSVLFSAMDLAAAHSVSIGDALILAAAARACGREDVLATLRRDVRRRTYLDRRLDALLA